MKILPLSEKFKIVVLHVNESNFAGDLLNYIHGWLTKPRLNLTSRVTIFSSENRSGVPPDMLAI